MAEESGLSVAAAITFILLYKMVFFSATLWVESWLANCEIAFGTFVFREKFMRSAFTCEGLAKLLDIIKLQTPRRSAGVTKIKS